MKEHINTIGKVRVMNQSYSCSNETPYAMVSDMGLSKGNICHGDNMGIK